MTYTEGTPERGLQKLAVKYGGAAAIMLANTTVVQVTIMVIIGTIFGLIPGGPELLDTKTDIGFIFKLALNEIAAYTVPMITMYALFYRELKFEKTIYEPEMRYDRFFGETALLFVTGLGVSTALSIATSFISSFLNTVLGIPETKVAFNSMMPCGSGLRGDHLPAYSPAPAAQIRRYDRGAHHSAVFRAFALQLRSVSLHILVRLFPCSYYPAFGDDNPGGDMPRAEQFRCRSADISAGNAGECGT